MNRNIVHWCATLLLTLAAQDASAFCLNPFGCKPGNFEDCQRDAATKPTDAGVKLAQKLCREEFVEEPARQEAQRRRTLEDATWRMVQDGELAYPAIVKRLGQPFEKSGVDICVGDERAQVPRLCQSAEWLVHRSPNRECAVKATPKHRFDSWTDRVHMAAIAVLVFRADFYVDTGTVRVFYKEPINTCAQPLSASTIR